MGGGKIFWATLRGGPKFFWGAKEGGQNFFSGSKRGARIFFAPSVQFPILFLLQNFSYIYTITISQYIFNHTPGLKGHDYIAREVGCFEPQQGGGKIFSCCQRGGQNFFASAKGGSEKLTIAPVKNDTSLILNVFILS